jgi:small ligand-binding sensory domain FIST
MTRFASAISLHPESIEAAAEVVAQVAERLDGSPTLAVVFVSGSHVERAAQIASTVQALLAPSAFIGCSAGAVLGNGQGAEEVGAVSLWVAMLTGAATPVVLDVDKPGDLSSVSGFDHAAARGAKTLLLLPDPFSFPTAEFLAQIALEHPHLVAIGGMASSARMAGDNRLIADSRVLRRGAVGVLLDEAASPEPVVSQGCRPVGQAWTVTKADRNIIYELGGRLALDRLTEILESLNPADRLLAGQGLHCGIVANEQALDFERGDFVIRGVLGADRSVGAVVINDQIEVGATVQFQVRDAASASDDLRAMLTGHDGLGALVFTCNGRGSTMFGDAHHDATIVQDHLGRAAAVSGMFSAGEIGPVAGRNALHAFTASVALFS